MRKNSGLENRRSRIIEFSFLVLSGLVWIYFWLRAYYVPLAHDEIATFYYYIQTGEFLPSIAHWDANNHILNSALSWLLYQAFGHSSIVIRLANLLSFPLAAAFWLLLSRNVSDNWLRAGFLISFLFMHNFLEFFALSRGYGLSTGFLFGAIYFLVVYIRKPGTRVLLGTLIMILLAVAANLALFIVSLLIYLLLFLHIITTSKFKVTKDVVLKTLLIAVLGIIPAILFTIILFQMKEQDLLYYGAQDGIWEITARSLIKLLSGSASRSYEYFWAFITLLGLLGGSIITYRMFRNKNIFPGQLVFFYLLAGSSASVVALNIILGINYPEDRVGLYFYPFLAGTFFFSADVFPYRKLKWAGLLLFIWLPVDFFTKMNFTYAECYKTDFVPLTYFEHVAEDRKPDEAPPSVGSYRTRHFVWSYYDYLNGGSVVAPIFYANYPGSLTDYLISDLKNFPGWNEYYDTIDFETINQRYLLKRRLPVQKRLISDTSAITSDGMINNEYFLIFGTDARDLRGANLQIEFDLELESGSSPFEARLVFSVEDEDKNDLRYEYIQLDWMRKEWPEVNNRIHNILLMHDVPKTSQYLRLYIWSIEMDDYLIRDGNCKLYEIIP